MQRGGGSEGRLCRGVESDGRETHHDDGRQSEWMADGAGGEDRGGRQVKNASPALFLAFI